MKAKIAPAFGGGNGVVLFFTANNPEIYFTGFSLFVSKDIGDFECCYINGILVPTIPPLVSGTQAHLLTNYTPVNDTNLTIFVGGAMAFPDMRIYPPDAQKATGTPDSDPEFSLTSFNTIPDGVIPSTPFASGTYYFVAYAYSSVDNAYSLPSNIATLVFP